MSELRLTDFRMAGFLLAREIKFLRTEENEKGEVVFVFANPEGETLRFLNEYPNSPEQKYDSACRTMHDFVKSISKVKRRKKKRY